MTCKDCANFNKEEHWCEADMFEKNWPLSCIFKMILQELQLANLPEEGDDWKY